MFSKAALKLLKRSVKVVDTWATLPISWHESSGNVVVRTSKWRKCTWLLNFLAHVAHWAFLLTRYIDLRIVCPTSNDALKVYTEYVVITYSLPLVFHVTTYWRLEELVNLLNEYMNFRRILKGGAFTAKRLFK